MTLIRQRLRWKLDRRTWASGKRLRALRNSRAGEACVVVCNGPSLRQVDFELLGRFPTFGLNKINLLFEDTAWRPTYLVSVNPHVIEQNEAYFAETDRPLFLGPAARRYPRLVDNATLLYALDFNAVATDCSKGVAIGGTVTSVALQLAMHYGFTRIALVGCDHNFATKGPANQTVEGLEQDTNHFHPDYFPKGVVWQLPDLARSEMYYEMLRQRAEVEGREIWNCTEGGLLDVFPRLSLQQFAERCGLR